MSINVETLELLLEAKGLTQKALAEQSGVSSKTISRIIAGENRNSNKTTIVRIARALGVGAEELGASLAEKKLRELKENWHAFTSSRTIIDLDRRTDIHFDLVSARYGISPQAQIEAAPLLFTILAEMSLADRRKRLNDFQTGRDAVPDTGLHHLQRGIEIADYKMERLLDKEAASIEARDLSGATINGEDEFEGWWVEEEADVFVNFLKSLASGDDGSLIDIGGGTATNIEYSVLQDDLSRITGGDEFASAALRLGRVRVRDIPTNLLGEEMADARAVWLANHLTTDDRAELTAWREKLKALALTLKLDFGDTNSKGASK